jgi:isoquinoline 1-oxidoreductase subunit beta
MHVRTTGDNCYGPETRGLANPPYYVPNYHYEARLTHFHVPVGLRRGTGASLHAFYLESFIDELAHAARKDPYLYRRELISRNPPPPAEGIGGFRFRDDWLNALDLAAKISHWNSPLPRGWGRGLAIDDRRRLERKTATICAHVHTVSVTRIGQVRVHRVDLVFDQGFGLVNPRAVRKQIEGAIAFGYDDALYQAVTIKDGRAVEGNFNDYRVSPIGEYPRELNIAFFRTKRWIEGVGEEVMSGVAPAICNAVFQATGKRIRSLPLTKHDLRWS